MKFKKGDFIVNKRFPFKFYQFICSGVKHAPTTYHVYPEYAVTVIRDDFKFDLYFTHKKDFTDMFKRAKDDDIIEYLSFHVRSHIVNSLTDKFKASIKDI